VSHDHVVLDVKVKGPFLGFQGQGIDVHMIKQGVVPDYAIVPEPTMKNRAPGTTPNC